MVLEDGTDMVLMSPLKHSETIRSGGFQELRYKN
jgi:hypothetical protein